MEKIIELCRYKNKLFYAMCITRKIRSPPTGTTKNRTPTTKTTKNKTTITEVVLETHTNLSYFVVNGYLYFVNMYTVLSTWF